MTWTNEKEIITYFNIFGSNVFLTLKIMNFNNVALNINYPCFSHIGHECMNAWYIWYKFNF
jgi:hypothetical protein